MGLFTREPARPHLPANIVSSMEYFGSYEFDPMNSPANGGDIYSSIIAPLYPFAQADPERFTRELAAAVLPVGGWAAYGGSCCAWELLGKDAHNHQGFLDMLDATLDFLHEQRVPPMRFKGYQWDRWAQTRPGTW